MTITIYQTGTPDVPRASIGTVDGEVELTKDGIVLSGDASMGIECTKLNSIGVVADYSIQYADPAIVAVATTADIVLTLPQKSSLTDLSARRLPITAVQSNGYRVRVQCYAGDTFHNGHSWFDVPVNRRQTELIMHEHGMGVMTPMNYNARLHMEANWSSSNFSSATAIPFDSEDRNTQGEIFVWDSSTQLTIGATGEFEIAYGCNIDSTGGSTYTCTLALYKNGVEVPHSTVRGGNYGGEDDSITSIAGRIDLVSGDVLTVVADQNSLTGNMLDAFFVIDMQV